MRYSTRELVYIAVFGAIWGAIEMTLGSYLHVLNVPQTGTILSAMGVAILVVGRSFVPKRGATLLTGIVALFIKMFSLGGIVINPMIAIFMESLLVELGLGAKGISKVRCVLAGAMGTSWVIVHPFITQGIMAGWGMARLYIWLVEGGARLFGIPSRYAMLILALLFALKPIVGAIGGLIGWEMAIAVSRRLGRKVPIG
ncbi:MAG: hypothetical protein WBH57_12220 [Anaerolineae bacterium]